MAGDSDDIVIAMLFEVRAAAIAIGVRHEDAQRIAVTASGRIRERFGGARPYVRRPSKAGRNDEIALALSAGEPVAAVAKRVGMHPASVARIRRASLAPEGWEL